MNRMKTENDKIQFETRYEIMNVIRAIEMLEKDHPGDVHPDVERLKDLLDVMEMTW